MNKENEVRDPVCGMRVEPEKAAGHSSHNGEEYYFCSKHCKEKFDTAPESYTGGMPRPAPVAGSGPYTCPMHPEVLQEAPGDCPECGMALEPMTVSADDGKNPELVDMTRRFWLGLVLTIPVFVLAMSHMVPSVDHHSFAMSDLSRWIQFILSTPVVLVAGWPFFKRGWRSIITGRFNMFTLISIGVGAAYTYSVVAMLAPDVFPVAPEGGKPAIYFESAAMIIVLVLMGQVLELRARAKTGSAIRSLLDLAPETARIVEDGEERDVPLDTVVVGAARVQGERLGVDITSLEYQGTIIPVELVVFDSDGQEGIFIPNSMEVSAAKEVAANMGASLGSSINISTDAGAQLASDLGKGLIQGTSQYIAKKMRTVKVHLKAGYKVMLYQPES